ncbi:MAG: hypothetical protein EP329_04375 [Deltaproteobacteria bacterium]|nr:MAG: hypothetical protein EP329_04375 [Deltaproteobacteria bacterium]
MSMVYALIMWSWVMADPAHGSYVDVIGAQVPEAEQLMEKYPDDARIPDDEKLLPDAVRKVTRWTVVTEKGPTERKVTGISIRGGAGEEHVIYWLDGPKIDQGLAIAEPRPKAGPLRAVKGKAPAKAVTAKLMGEVVGALEEEHRKTVKKRPGKDDLEVVTLKTGKGPLTLAFVHIPQGETFDGYLAAVAVIAKDGAVTKWITKPNLGINKQEPQYLVDPEGDGTDALVVDDSYYEGWYRTILTFDAKGEPKIKVLTGDGA